MAFVSGGFLSASVFFSALLMKEREAVAKIASKLAKKYEVYKHCCMIDSDYKREKTLEWCPIEDVWGIGRRYAARCADVIKLH